MRHQLLCWSAVALVAVCVSCGGDKPPALTDEALANAEYPSELGPSGKVKLHDGRYDEQNPGGVGRTTVTLLEARGRGRIDADKAEDVAVVLVASGGGSGSFYSLVVVLNKKGPEGRVPEAVAATALGDRVVVHSVEVTDRKIVLKMREHGPQDPLCCPSLETIRTYTYDGELKLVSKATIGVN